MLMAWFDVPVKSYNIQMMQAITCMIWYKLRGKRDRPHHYIGLIQNVYDTTNCIVRIMIHGAKVIFLDALGDGVTIRFSNLKTMYTYQPRLLCSISPKYVSHRSTITVHNIKKHTSILPSTLYLRWTKLWPQNSSVNSYHKWPRSSKCLTYSYLCIENGSRQWSSNI